VPLCPVDGHAGAHDSPEDLEHLAILGVSVGFVLGVDELAVDPYVVDALGTRDQAQVADDVLVVGEEVPDRAHGAR